MPATNQPASIQSMISPKSNCWLALERHQPAPARLAPLALKRALSRSVIRVMIRRSARSSRTKPAANQSAINQSAISPTSKCRFALERHEPSPPKLARVELKRALSQHARQSSCLVASALLARRRSIQRVNPMRIRRALSQLVNHPMQLVNPIPVVSPMVIESSSRLPKRHESPATKRRP